MCMQVRNGLSCQRAVLDGNVQSVGLVMVLNELADAADGAHVVLGLCVSEVLETLYHPVRNNKHMARDNRLQVDEGKTVGGFEKDLVVDEETVEVVVCNGHSGAKDAANMPTDSLEIINRIRAKSPERLTQIEKQARDAANRFKELPEDSEQIINKIRSRSPDKISQFERNKMNTFKEMPDDASEIINKIRSKSPQRISEFEKARKSKFDNVPEDAMEIINRIRKAKN